MIIQCKDREEWLAERARLDVNASNAAAILGYDTRFNALDVYTQKKTGEELEDNDAMLLGRCLEDGIAKAWAAKTGRPVLDPGDYTIWVHDEFPWLGATPDRLTTRVQDRKDFGGTAPLQIKHAGWFKRHEWHGEPPLWLQIQVQMEIACTGATWGAYGAVVGGAEIHYGDLDANRRFFESCIPVFEDFRRRLRDNDPPPVTSPKNLYTVKQLYPHDSGETVKLNDEHLTLANRLDVLKAAIKEIEDEKKQIEAKLRAAIGEATFGSLPDGSMLSLTTTKRKGYVLEVAETTFRTLRRKAL